jgi:hypothetical protein
MDEQQRNDQLLASAVTFLIDGGEEKAAAVLLSCTFTYQEFQAYEYGRGNYLAREIILMAPRVSYNLLNALDKDYHDYKDLSAPDDPPEKVHICRAIRAAFAALIDFDVEFTVRASLVPITAQWREELLALLRGDHVTNQGLQFSPKPPRSPGMGSASAQGPKYASRRRSSGLSARQPSSYLTAWRACSKPTAFVSWSISTRATAWRTRTGW